MSWFDLTAAAAGLEEYRELADITDMIYLWYRDVLVYKTTQNEGLIIEKDLTPAIKTEAERASFEGLYKIPKLINETKKTDKAERKFCFCP